MTRSAISRLSRVAVAAMAVAAGCYNPRFRDNIACDVDLSCPSGTTCGTDRICHVPGSSGAPDAAVVDGALPDVPDAEVFVSVLSGVPEPRDLVPADDGYLYYTDLGSAGIRTGVVGRAIKTGGGGAMLSGLVQPTSMIVVGGYIYWLDIDPSTNGPVVSMTAAGGGAIDSLGLLGFSLASDGVDVYIQSALEIDKVVVGTLTPFTVAVSDVSSDVTGNSLLVDTTDLYWVEAVRNQNGVLVNSFVRKRAKSGGNVVTLASDSRPLESIAMDGAFVYGMFRSTELGAGPDNGAIVRVSRNGGGFETIAAGQSPQRVAVDTDHVYWINRYATAFGAIMRCPKVVNCVPEVVVSHGAGLVMGMDATTLYWANGSGIFRKTKP